MQTDNPYQKNAAIKSTANNFLEQLRAEGDQNKGATLFKLQNALNKGNFAEVENILKQNNVAIPQPQQAQPAPIQQNPVKENKPPENILTQPANTSGNEKLIKQASKIITKRTSHEGKKKIGNAILQLANQNGISVPAVDFKSLQNGSSKKIAEWQAKLSQAGAFAISPPQTSTSNKTSANEAVESKTAEGTTVFTPQSVIQAEEQKKNSLKYRAQQVLDKLSAQHTKNVLREREADLSNDETNEAVPFDYFNYVNDDEAPSPAELQRQENEKTVQKYQAQQEEYRQWQAKQNKELEELKARQAEEKPLRDEARQEEEQRRNGTQTQGQPQAQSQVKTAPTVQESDEQEVQPKSQETVEQEQPSNIKEYHASDYDTHVVFHGRKSPDAPERPTDGKSIADALKAIVQAPAGTRIEGKYAFQVEPDVFEIKDRAGRKMIGGVYSRHRPVVLNPANAYKFFGNAREVRVIYPKEKNETPIQPSEVTTPESTTESQEGEIRQNNTVANSDNAEVSDNKSVQQSEETNEAEDLFVVGEGQYPRNGENYYTAKVDSSKLPLGRLGDNADYRLSRLAERYSQQDKFSRGTYKFSSAQARDSFIKDVKNSQILSREVESQRPFSKIFNDAKEEAYRILEADKYPEIKDWLDRQTKNQVDTIVMTGDIEKASEFAEGLVKSVRSHKDAGKLANSVLYENLNKWETTKRSTSRGLSGKLREKYNKAEDIISQYTEQIKQGEATLEDAHEDLNRFLKTGRRRKATKPPFKVKLIPRLIISLTIKI